MNTEQLGDLWSQSTEWLNRVWHLELYKSGDSSVAFNQVFIAVTLVMVGLLISKRLSCAIGVGFGAQNLINNLISGIILMAEKPIRIGDIIVLGDSQGKVASIGNRCTRIRRGDGVDVLVPHSHFLEQQVVNWTLHDSELRGTLTMGDAYGSPTLKIKEILLQAADEHPRVLKTQVPFVLFEDFGDNALVFSLLFWSSVSMPMDLRRVTSDMRFRIDALFADAGITIAFPQRDIHLDTLKSSTANKTGYCRWFNDEFDHVSPANQGKKPNECTGLRCHEWAITAGNISIVP